MRKLLYLLSGIVVLSTSIACASQTDQPGNGATHQNASTVTSIDSSTASKSRPNKKTVTDEWTQRQIPVKLFNQNGFPFTTYFPENDFVVESAAADEGMGVWFYSKASGKKYQSAYVHFFFPAQSQNLEGMRSSVVGKRGLMETNKWTVKRRTQNVPYRWAKERIDFEKKQGNKSIMGTVYLGEYKGKAFRVTEHFPADYGDGFAPRASIILKELQLNN
ncbi:hypothetical protein [Allocoleopsis franciscana]|uniref:Lipoprotein n=1 Tax=Allocoleopsis franciscana PCC 7113 TaxID=1173027 RepID=K9WEJ0_9CYAN|nr:hypothetical protein [Allocoleopsis franciscana]AFZ18216.1 hypothetical protein Mic7113_2414 [Allocoleopsis franciscana PCC 7113]